MYNIIIKIYLKYDFIMTFPATCDDKTCPWGDMSKFTDSRTSKNSSFRRYLIPSRRHPIWPVTCEVIWACSSFVWLLIPCWVIKVFKAPTYNDILQWQKILNLVEFRSFLLIIGSLFSRSTHFKGVSVLREPDYISICLRFIVSGFFRHKLYLVFVI